ncbi:hypothetical protein O6H91_22G016700 [Diphasiastrum complanatum]|nr:hypothetical protein O6H91_22G016700 [Diphasiastrum complanatum]
MANVLLSSGTSEKKGFLDWLNEAFSKEAFSETDPILKKVEDKNGAASAKPAAQKKGASSNPSSTKKKGFFGK